MSEMEPKSLSEQFIPFEVRLGVESDVSRILGGGIVTGGCAYELNMLDALSGSAVSAGRVINPTPEWLTHRKRLRYVGDVDFYSTLTDEGVVSRLGPTYEQRSSKYTKDAAGKDRPRQRKIRVGTVQLKQPIDGNTELPAELAVDVIDPGFYTKGYFNRGIFPDPAVALAGLESHASTANIGGQHVRFQGVNDFIAFKLTNMQRIKDENGAPKTWIKDVSDVANLIAYRSNHIDWNYIATLMGSAQVTRERLKLVRDCLADPSTSMEEGNIKQLMAEQVIEPFNEVSRYTLVDFTGNREKYIRKVDEAALEIRRF
ncbi:MAG: hypothetical protein HY362_03930 [Candidatus Aenigmarchaeota archaeon]|nr:hypothetical protein [Candidatus Aenigmarchaeota archaeon]